MAIVRIWGIADDGAMRRFWDVALRGFEQSVESVLYNALASSMERKLSAKKEADLLPKQAMVVSLGIWVGTYALSLALALFLAFRTPSLGLRSAVMLLPLLPAVGILLWQVRTFQRMDEMQSRHQLLAVAWAFAGTAIFVIGYSLMEVAGWPHLPMFAVWLVMLTFWVASIWLQRFRYR